MDVMINIPGTDQIVVESRLAANNYDYHLYTYDSGDQFNLLEGATPTTMAGFERWMNARFSAITGAPTDGFWGDIQKVTYANAAEGGGVSVFNLGT